MVIEIVKIVPLITTRAIITKQFENIGHQFIGQIARISNSLIRYQILEINSYEKKRKEMTLKRLQVNNRLFHYVGYVLYLQAYRTLHACLYRS